MSTGQRLPITPGDGTDLNVGSVLALTSGVAVLVPYVFPVYGICEGAPVTVTLAAGERYSLPGGATIRRVLAGTTAGLVWGSP